MEYHPLGTLLSCLLHEYPAEEDIDVSNLLLYAAKVEEPYLHLLLDSSLRFVLLALKPRYCEDDSPYPVLEDLRGLFLWGDLGLVGIKTVTMDVQDDQERMGWQIKESCIEAGCKDVGQDPMGTRTAWVEAKSESRGYVMWLNFGRERRVVHEAVSDGRV